MISHNRNDGCVEIIEINQWLTNFTNDCNSINYDKYKPNHSSTYLIIVTTLKRS